MHRTRMHMPKVPVTPVGAVIGREGRTAACLRDRGDLFAGRARSHRYRDPPCGSGPCPPPRSPLWKLALPAKAAPTGTAIPPCGSGLCPRRPHPRVPRSPPVGAGSAREGRTHGYRDHPLWERALPAKAAPTGTAITPVGAGSAREGRTHGYCDHTCGSGLCPRRPHRGSRWIRGPC